MYKYIAVDSFIIACTRNNERIDRERERQQKITISWNGNNNNSGSNNKIMCSKCNSSGTCNAFLPSSPFVFSLSLSSHTHTNTHAYYKTSPFSFSIYFIASSLCTKLKRCSRVCHCLSLSRWYRRTVSALLCSTRLCHLSAFVFSNKSLRVYTSYEYERWAYDMKCLSIVFFYLPSFSTCKLYSQLIRQLRFCLPKKIIFHFVSSTIRENLFLFFVNLFFLG